MAKALDAGKGEWRLAPRASVLPTWERRGREDELGDMADSVIRCLPEDKTNGFFVSCFERVDGDAELGEPATMPSRTSKSSKAVKRRREHEDDEEVDDEQDQGDDGEQDNQEGAAPRASSAKAKTAAQLERAKRKKQQQKKRRKQTVTQ